MSFMKGNVLTKTRLLMKGGIVTKPRWLDAVESVPPVASQTRTKRPPKIRYPEDRLVESYYARHPDAVCTPIDLTSFEPPPARKFAWRQLELMQQGLFRDAARDVVEAEDAEARKAVEEKWKAERRKAIREGREPPPMKKSAIEAAQDEEWIHISRGLRNTRQF